MSQHSAVAHQFEDAGQQREAATLGMWVFLATEILFFGALFVAYAVYRLRWPQEFRHGSMDLKWYLGGFNTAVLLGSSFFMAMAVHGAQRGNQGAIIRNLWLTILLASCFLVIKATEYYLEYEEGLVPGRVLFQTTKPDESRMSSVGRAFEHFEEHLKRPGSPVADDIHRPPEEKLFMSFYFIMTGIHATHMIIGICVMLALIQMAKRGTFAVNHNPVEMTGLYWHFVDTVWVFLFPILYLLRFV